VSPATSHSDNYSKPPKTEEALIQRQPLFLRLCTSTFETCEKSDGGRQVRTIPLDATDHISPIQLKTRALSGQNLNETDRPGRPYQKDPLLLFYQKVVCVIERSPIRIDYEIKANHFYVSD
jgi:hypothetical protein